MATLYDPWTRHLVVDSMMLVVIPLRRPFLWIRACGSTAFLPGFLPSAAGYFWRPEPDTIPLLFFSFLSLATMKLPPGFSPPGPL